MNECELIGWRNPKHAREFTVCNFEFNLDGIELNDVVYSKQSCPIALTDAGMQIGSYSPVAWTESATAARIHLAGASGGSRSARTVRGYWRNVPTCCCISSEQEAHLKKASPSRRGDAEPPSNVIRRRDFRSAKQRSPIISAEAGIEMIVRDVNEANASATIAQTRDHG
jgi:hypothetical protein